MRVAGDLAPDWIEAAEEQLQARLGLPITLRMVVPAELRGGEGP